MLNGRPRTAAAGKAATLRGFARKPVVPIWDFDLLPGALPPGYNTARLWRL